MTREQAEELVINEIAAKGHGIIGKEVTFSDELHDNLFQYAIDLRMKSFVWTREKPTQPGWYWFKGAIEFPFADHEGITKLRYNPQVVFFQDEGFVQITSEHFIFNVKAFEGLWAGPLTPPEEESVKQ